MKLKPWLVGGGVALILAVGGLVAYEERSAGYFVVYAIGALLYLINSADGSDL